MPQGGVKLRAALDRRGRRQGRHQPGLPRLRDHAVSTGNNSVRRSRRTSTRRNGSKLPNAPGCPAPTGTERERPGDADADGPGPDQREVVQARRPTSSAPSSRSTPARRTTTSSSILLDSAYAGQPANPTDKNLAFYQPTSSTMKYPVGVNLAHGDTGLFTQCVNGTTGCAGTAGTITTCVGTSDLAGTGFDDPQPGEVRQRTASRAARPAGSPPPATSRRRDHHAAHRDLGHQRSRARLARADRRVHSGRSMPHNPAP